MPSAADDDAAQWRNIAEIPAPSDDDMIGAYAYVIRGIEVDPAEWRAKHRNPGVRRVRPQQRRVGSRRRGPQITTDVTCRKTPRAQAGEHDVGEILASAAPRRERLDCRRADVGGAGLVAEITMYLMHQRFRARQQRAAR